MNHAAHIIIGKIGATYGVHCWLKIQTYTEFGPNILEYQPWYLIDAKQQSRSIEVEEGRTHNNGIIAKLKGINNPEEARLLTGQLIAIDRAQLPALKKNEYYWSDLTGLTVVNKEGTVYGKVAYLMTTGSNDVLVVKNDKEYAIPFLLGSVILDVDLKKQIIHVDWELI